MSFGTPGETSIAVSGDLDVESAATFGPLVMGVHGLFGPDASYDFTGVVARDAAGRSTLGQVAHEFREHGLLVAVPVDGDAAGTDRSGYLSA
ncbi:hypothetical protein [Georgenia faecalis]|uniref:Dienelactone hydrolase domain-containing protein n=1 Tax=Georgenia faecalis TaxID=2483799 RepID=A0ABV9D4W9_9MICO|nr:hypothetical protein [Georgenia faecalis]